MSSQPAPPRNSIPTPGKTLSPNRGEGLGEGSGMGVFRARLGDVAEFVNGLAFKPADWEENGKRIIRIQNLTNPLKPFNRTRREVAEKFVAMPGDILVSWSATIGVFIWNDPEDAIVNQHIFRVIPDHEQVDSTYLRHMLVDALVEMERHLHGATMKHINRREFLDTTIPLPPLEEQKRIAEILDAADALRARRRESLAQLDTLLQSTFIEMFGDPVTNPMGWEKAILEDFAVKVTDGDHHTPKRTDSGIKLLSARNVLDGEIDLSNTDFVGAAEYERMIKRCHPEQGDILISCSGSIGRVSRIRFDEPVVLVRSAALVKVDHTRAVTEFLEQLLRTPALNAAMLRAAKSVAQANLFQKPIKNLPVFVPPLELQQRFAAIVESVEQQKVAQRAHLMELDTLFAALQQRAFAGELVA
jgi:type I restriction enzyme, S subunit